LHTAVLEFIYASQHKKHKAAEEMAIAGAYSTMNMGEMVDLAELSLLELYNRITADMVAPCIVRSCELLADIVHTNYLITQWHRAPFDSRNDDPLFCPVQRGLDARDHAAKEAGSVANPPAALGNHGSHITTAKMVKFIRATVTAFDPSIPKEELIRYTVHSIRIGSLFRLLNNCAATDSISVDVIAHFLRWNSTAYQLYVRSCGTNFAKLSNKDKSELAAQFDKDADHDPEVDGDFANLV
jgi:hypothetical protein